MRAYSLALFADYGRFASLANNRAASFSHLLRAKKIDDWAGSGSKEARWCLQRIPDCQDLRVCKCDAVMGASAHEGFIGRVAVSHDQPLE